MTQPQASQDPSERNVRVLATLEHSNRVQRGIIERVVDRLGVRAGYPSFAVVHALWFGLWLSYNTWSPEPFDPYPFDLLALVVSLEAILLTSFVLSAQSRMTSEADRRAKLDLQIDMLAEQELTAILRSLKAVADHSGIDLRTVVPDLSELTSDTRIDRLAKRLADDEKDASASA